MAVKPHAYPLKLIKIFLFAINYCNFATANEPKCQAIKIQLVTGPK